MYLSFKSCRKQKATPAGVAQWIEHQPANPKVTSSISSQSTCLGCRPGPHLGHVRGNRPINVSLTHQCFSPSLSPSFPLSKMNKYFLKRKQSRVANQQCNNHTTVSQ